MLTFKEKLSKAQQGQADTSRAPARTSNDWKAAGYHGLIGHLSQRSQAFEPGDLLKPSTPSHNTSTKRRHSTQIIEADYEDEPFQQPKYYERVGSQMGSNNQGSLINSKMHDPFNPSLLESRLNETKGEIADQILDLERKFKRDIDENKSFIAEYIKKHLAKFESRIKSEENSNFETIISQLNRSLNTFTKKNKSLEATLNEEMEANARHRKQFAEFVQETEEKMERIMNNDASSSIRKSSSRMDSNYVMELKSSMKEIPLAAPTMGQELRAELNDIHESIRSFTYDLEEIKKELKDQAKLQTRVEKNTEVVDSSKMALISDDIKRLDRQLHDFFASHHPRMADIDRIQRTHEENIAGMNKVFMNVINNNVIPRLEKSESQLQSLPTSFEYRMDGLKKTIIKDLESMPILRVSRLNEKEQGKLTKMREAEGKQRQVYLLDESNFILDCFGNYLVDESNRRVQVAEEQIYYLQEVEGINFSSKPRQVPAN